MTKPKGVKLTKLVSAISLTVLCSTGYTQSQTARAASAECAALELESSSTVTSARQLACYNERLTNLSDLLAGLISEREKLNSTLGDFAESELAQSDPDNQTVNQQLETIKQLQLERAELRSQLHRLLSEKQSVQLNQDTDERLFRNYSEAYIALSKENTELKKLLADYQVTAKDQRLLIEAESKSNQQQAEVINQLNEEITTLKQTIEDLSTGKTELDNQFSKAESRIELLQRQLLNNVNLIQNQNNNLTAAQQKNNQQTQALDLTDQQLAEAQTLNTELKALTDQYHEETTIKGQAISDLSTHRMALDVKYGNALTELNRLDQQLQSNTTLIQTQVNSITAAQQSSEIQAVELESTKQQLANSHVQASETETTLNTIIDDLNGQIETIAAQRDEITTRAEDAAQKSQQLSAQHENQLTELNAEITELHSNRDELKAMLVSAEEQLLATNSSFTEQINQLNEKNSAINADNIDLTDMLSAANAETNQLSMQSTKNMASLADLEAELAKVMQSAADNIAELTKANDSAVRDNRVLEDQIANLTTDLGQLEKQRDSLMKELEGTNVELQAVNKTFDAQTEENQALQGNIASLENNLRESKEMANNLQQSLSNSEAEKTRTEGKVTTLTAAVKSLEEILDETVANNSFIEASLGDIKNDLNASQQRLDAKQLELKELMAEKKALIDARNALNNESKLIAESIKKQLQNSDVNSVTVNRLSDNTLALKVDSSQLFRTGSSRLSDDGQQILSAVGDAIAQIENRRIMIEGHSDNVPLGAKLSAIFKDNLGLSMARALSTAKFFTDVANIPANNMSVSGAGATKPLASNETDEGRQKNRRVEILLLPSKDQ